MTPLLAFLLADAAQGLWRIESFGPVQLDLIKSFNRSVIVVDDLNLNDKSQLMDQLATALHLPGWFGRNWDALNDSLAELTTTPTWPDVVVLSPIGHSTNGLSWNRANSNLQTLAEILGDLSQSGAGCFLIVGPQPNFVPLLSAKSSYGPS